MTIRWVPIESTKHQRTTVWLRPPRPDWMSEEEYAQCPEQIEIRLVDVIIEQPGFRSKKYTIATTILGHEVFTRDWITNVYRSRWLVELDIQGDQMFVGHGHHSSENTRDGTDRNLVVPVGLQLDSDEDVAKLLRKWTDASNTELYDDVAVAGQQLAAGQCAC